MENLEWKQVLGFSNYEASNNGLLRSLNYKKTGKIQILKPALSPDGYWKTMIKSDEGKYVSRPIHYFITLAFYGQREDGFDVNHIDGNKNNNNISNLEYCSHSYNCLHAFKLKLMVPKHGSINGNSKLSEQDVIDIREYVAKSGKRYYGRKELAKKYNISEAHLKDIVSKRRDIWKYV
jgi:hypothetical protein